jgi:hypothetical protein
VGRPVGIGAVGRGASAVVAAVGIDSVVRASSGLVRVPGAVVSTDVKSKDDCVRKEKIEGRVGVTTEIVIESAGVGVKTAVVLEDGVSEGNEIITEGLQNQSDR